MHVHILFAKHTSRLAYPNSHICTHCCYLMLNWLNINSPVKEFESPSVWVKRYKRFDREVMQAFAPLWCHTHQCQPFFSTAPCTRILNTTDIGAQCTTKALLCTNHIQHFLPPTPPPSTPSDALVGSRLTGGRLNAGVALNFAEPISMWSWPWLSNIYSLWTNA